MKSANIPHDDFREGFIVGFQLILGTNVGVRGAPGGPGVHGATSRFLVGVKAGIRAAGGEILGPDKQPIS